VICLPASTAPEVFTVSSSIVRMTSRPHFAIGTTTKAVSSRVKVTIFALTI
jgi:hypothetical protein